MRFWTYNAECLGLLKTWVSASFDAVVTDPPYELGFMSKDWDASGIAFSVELWREVLRVLKPGAHLLAFGGTRTYHRMTCAIEDAGFEIRDSLHWFYGTGFPKSRNVGEGRGTALKPGHEPIALVRKPLVGTVAANVAQFSTGSLNIDVSMIPVAAGDRKSRGGPNAGADGSRSFEGGVIASGDNRDGKGRWPANVLLDEDAAAELDAQSGACGARAPVQGSEPSAAVGDSGITSPRRRVPGAFHGDLGGASRFFYVAKPSRTERDAGCEALPERSGGEATGRVDGSAGTQNPRAGAGRTGGSRNFHPTVKPVALMQYLTRLITPPDGVVLDPFMGSGSTGIAAAKEGFRFVGIEKELPYFTIANARLALEYR